MSASAAEDQPASVAARRTCSPAPARPARRPTPPPVAPPQRPARRRPRSAARPAGWASLTSARQDPAHATHQRRRHGAIIGARSPGVTAMGGDTKSGRDGNGGGSERSAGGGEGGPGAPRGRSLADPLFGAGRRARRRGPNSLTRADGAGVAAGRHRARTGTARAGTRVPAAPSRRWSPGRHRIGIHSVATPIDQLRADPPSRPWSVTAGSARAGARRGPPWTVLGADNPSTSSPRIGLARKDGRRLGRLTVRERRERSGSSSPAFTGIVHAEGSIHSWANQLRTNDDAPIRDGEHPPSFRALASAQVSYIRCSFGAYYREPRPYRGRVAAISGSDGSKEEVLWGFAPRTTDAPPTRAADRFDIVVSTDVLSEGVNLQQARHIVNYDLPWNPMRLVQRHVRIDRIGSRCAEVFLRCIFPDRQLDELLGLEERLQLKLRQALASVGVAEVLPGGPVADIGPSVRKL